MGKIRIAVLGSILYDCVAWCERLPRLGETVVGSKSGFFTGGKGANQAVQAAKLGAEVYMIGKVGKDATGKIMLDAIESFGLNTDFVCVDENVTTGTSCIHVDSNGDNAIVTIPMANMSITVKDIEKAMSMIDSFDIFILQLETSLESVEYALSIVKDKEIKVVFNPAPAKEIPDSLLACADYVTPNETETEFFTGIVPDAGDVEKCTQAAEALCGKGAKNVILTLGSGGSFFYDGKRGILVPPYKINAVDVTAAGDAFNAAFAFKMAQNSSVEEAMKYANAVGAFAASRPGAQQSLGTYAEIEEFIQLYR